MSSPEGADAILKAAFLPKPHPACPGRSRCNLKGCIHNAPISRFSTDGISVNLYEVNGMLGAYPSVRFGRGLLYQRLCAASELVINVREIDDEPKETIGTMVYIAQTKIREVSGNILDRIRFCLSSEMPV